jgi:hypothetical protein
LKWKWAATTSLLFRFFLFFCCYCCKEGDNNCHRLFQMFCYKESNGLLNPKPFFKKNFLLFFHPFVLNNC